MPDREAHIHCKAFSNEGPQLAEGAIIVVIAEEQFSALYAGVHCDTFLVSLHPLVPEELIDLGVLSRLLSLATRARAEDLEDKEDHAIDFFN